MSRLRKRRWIWTAGHAGALAAVLVIAGSAAPVRGADHTVAVVSFYAPSPVVEYSGLVPEEYVAADLSDVFSTASRGRLLVVPRDRVRAGENALRWRTADALSFARLHDIATVVGADRVVVGWIRQLVVEGNGGGGGIDLELGGGAVGLLTGLAVIEYQVFDAGQGRIIYETELEGHAVGGVSQPRVAQATLNDADRRGAAQLIGPLTSPTTAQ